MPAQLKKIVAVFETQTRVSYFSNEIKFGILNYYSQYQRRNRNTASCGCGRRWYASAGSTVDDDIETAMERDFYIDTCEQSE